MFTQKKDVSVENSCPIVESLPYIKEEETLIFLECYDGDTCFFDWTGIPDIFGKRISVRLQGIDTPEIRGKCENEKLFAKNVRDFVQNKLLSAKNIELKNLQRDKYFRVNAIIFADEENISETLIEKGFAEKYDGGTKTANWCN